MPCDASSPLVRPYLPAKDKQIHPFLKEGDLVVERPAGDDAGRLDELHVRLKEQHPEVYHGEITRRLPDLSRMVAELAGPRRRLELLNIRVEKLGGEAASSPAPVVLAKLLRGHAELIARRFRSGAVLTTFRDVTFEELFGETSQERYTDDERFRAFMKRIGLVELTQPARVAERVVKALRMVLPQPYPDELFHMIQNFLRYNPGRGLEREEFQQLWDRHAGQMGEDLERVYGELNATLKVIYAPINAEIDRAHARFEVPLRLEKQGLAAFVDRQPYGLADPGHGVMFRLCRVDPRIETTPHPTWFLVIQVKESRIIFPVDGDFPPWQPGQSWRVSDVAIPLTRAQLRMVDSQAREKGIAELVEGRAASDTVGKMTEASLESSLAEDARDRRRATQRLASLEELREMYG